MQKEPFQKTFRFKTGLEFTLASTFQFHLLPRSLPCSLHTSVPSGDPHPTPTALCFPADAALLFPSSEALEQQQPRYPVCSILVWKPPLPSTRGGLREFAVSSGGELTGKSSACGTGCWDSQPQRWHGTHTLPFLLDNVQKPGDSKCVKIAVIFFLWE